MSASDRPTVHIEFTPGLPPHRSRMHYLGLDATGAVWVLRWIEEKACFGALGFRTIRSRPWPELVLLRDGEDHQILGHAEFAQGEAVVEVA